MSSAVRNGIPDLSHTVIDSETGEVIHQGAEGPAADTMREEGRELWQEIYAKRRERKR